MKNFGQSRAKWASSPAVKAFSSELVACCASPFKRREASVERGIGMVLPKSTLFVSGYSYDVLVLFFFVFPVPCIV